MDTTEGPKTSEERKRRKSSRKPKSVNPDTSARRIALILSRFDHAQRKAVIRSAVAILRLATKLNN